MRVRIILTELKTFKTFFMAHSYPKSFLHGYILIKEGLCRSFYEHYTFIASNIDTNIALWLLLFLSYHPFRIENPLLFDFFLPFIMHDSKRTFPLEPKNFSKKYSAKNIYSYFERKIEKCKKRWIIKVLKQGALCHCFVKWDALISNFSYVIVKFELQK